MNGYVDKCYADEKHMILPSNQCRENMLYLEPLHQLILKFLTLAKIIGILQYNQKL